MSKKRLCCSFFYPASNVVFGILKIVIGAIAMGGTFSEEMNDIVYTQYGFGFQNSINRLISAYLLLEGLKTLLDALLVPTSAWAIATNTNSGSSKCNASERLINT